MTRSTVVASIQHNERRRRQAMAASAILIPLIIVGMGIMLFQQLVSANRLVAERGQAEYRRTLLISVLSDHKDVETGQRGYIITGDPDHLAPYVSGLENLETSIPQLETSYRNRPADLAVLRAASQISTEKLKFVSRSVNLMKTGDGDAAVALVRQGQGKRLMDELRGHLNTLLNREVVRLDKLSVDANAAIARFRLAVFSLLFTLVLLLGLATIIVSRMLGARNNALLALEDTSSRRAAILNSAMDGILILNPSGTIESANAAAQRMFGYSESELDSRDVGMLFADSPALGAVAQHLQAMHLKVGEPGSLREIQGQRATGEQFPTDVAVTVAPLAEGLRYVAIIRDISDRKRVERLKAEFVSTVSHELRTPLSSIAGSLGLLTGGAGGELGERARRLVDIAQSNATRLVKLINDILDIEKLESGKLVFHNQSVNLPKFLAQVAEENRGFAAKYGSHIELIAGDEPAEVSADPDRLAQVLTNLLSNAIKFSPEGETVRLVLVPGRTHHRICVEDRGPGLSEEFKGRIFERFAQADSSDSRAKGGTGLGLSIVREIVTRLNGQITFADRPGGGTVFTATLPADVSAGQPAIQSRRLLLVGTGAQPPLAAAVENLGYLTRSVPDEPAAAALLETERFDAVVPVGMIAAGAIERLTQAAGASSVNLHSIMALSPAGAQWRARGVQPAELAAEIDEIIQTGGQAKPAILHVDDDPDVLRLVAAALAGRVKVTSARSLDEARKALAKFTPDLVILDLTLRDGKGPDLLKDLKSPSPPVIVFSAEDDNRSEDCSFDAFCTKASVSIQDLVEVVESTLRRAAERKTSW